MKLNKLAMFGLVFLAVFIMIIIGSFKTANVTKEDIFEGVITNIRLEPGILEGTGVYDRSCNPVEKGLTQCDAGIQTEKGLLNFNYKHNMHAQGCIAKGDKLEIQVLENNEAIVRRI